jgi:hypothetical protein
MAFIDVIKHVQGVFSKDAFKKFADESEVRLEEIKEFIIQEILAHPVSQELDAKTSPSSFLNSSTASLYGLIGFHETDPVSDLVDYIEEVMVITKSKATLYNRIAGSYAKLFFPERKHFRADSRFMISHYNDGGRSWVEMIEDGISGFDHYLQAKDLPNSWSKEGIQVRNKYRDADVPKIEYLTEIFAKARKRIKNIK